MTPALSKQGLLLHLLVIGAARRTGAAFLTNWMISFMQEPESKVTEQSCLCTSVSLPFTRRSSDSRVDCERGWKESAQALAHVYGRRNSNPALPHRRHAQSHAVPRSRICWQRSGTSERTLSHRQHTQPRVRHHLFLLFFLLHGLLLSALRNNNGSWKSRVSLCCLSCPASVFGTSERNRIICASVYYLACATRRLLSLGQWDRKCFKAQISSQPHSWHGLLGKMWQFSFLISEQTARAVLGFGTWEWSGGVGFFWGFF